MKRQFNNVEKALCWKRINEMKEENEHLAYLIKYTDLMLTEGLKINVRQKEKEMKGQKQECERQINTNVGTIKVLEEQIRNGVDIKEKKRPTGVD